MRRLWLRFVAWAHEWLQERVAGRRPPDLVIGGDENPYLLRWWVIPRNRVFNIYLHLFLRDDDDRALHDHPWPNMSLLLLGAYIEHTIDAGGIHRRTRRSVGDIVCRLPWRAHRVELYALPWGAPEWLDKCPCWTLFVTGPRIRHWGFHCPEQGWLPWEKFTSSDGREVGRGCDQ